MNKIPSTGNFITDKEIQLVTEAVTKGWYSDMNMHIDQFIKEFSKFTDTPYCLPVSHCTAALHLSMIALGIGPGDEVIVPDITWVATATAPAHVGAKVVFCDIDPVTWCMSAETIEKKISKKTKAIIVVGLFGNLPNMDEILQLAKKYKIHLVEDAAESLGSLYKGKVPGTLGEIGLYSFNATKLVMSGQGGMLITKNKKLYEKARLYSHHGIDKTPGARYYWSNVIGYNYNWTNMQAALALAQFRRLNEFIQIKTNLFKWYTERLSDIEGLQLNQTDSNATNSFWLISGVLHGKNKIKKELIIGEMKKDNIDVRPFFYPISAQPAFKKFVIDKNMKKLNPISYSISPYGVSFPSGLKLSEADVDRVCTSFKRALQKY